MLHVILQKYYLGSVNKVVINSTTAPLILEVEMILITGAANANITLVSVTLLIFTLQIYLFSYPKLTPEDTQM